jgi:hypothetical protein
LRVVEATGGSSKSNKFTSFCCSDEPLELEVIDSDVFLSEDTLDRLLFPRLDLLSSDGEILPDL